MVFVFRILTREKMKKQRKRKIENTKNLISMRRPIYSRVEVEGFFRLQRASGQKESNAFILFLKKFGY